MLRRVTILVSLVGVLLLASAPIHAQLQTAPPQPAAARPMTSEMEGTVKKIDAASGTVQVSTGLWGLLGRTLAVTGETQIQLEGRQASLADIREGTKVKASYEVLEGKSVARRIEVMPPPQAVPPQRPKAQ
jgi:Cu/Ag efflux protein CusF